MISSTSNWVLGEILEGDFFIDCTGFRSLLLNGALGVEHVDLSKYLFVDRALVTKVPYLEESSDIHSMTLSSAHSAGWIWDIGLSNRRGIGLVYSSAHMSEDVAAQTMGAYLRTPSDECELRSIKFESRRLKTFWKNNAVAVGLSGGFVEPLEASAIVFVELAAELVC